MISFLYIFNVKGGGMVLMKIEKVVFVVDSHTMGEPTRVVVGGVPYIPGSTMAEKKRYLEENMDYLRTALMHEPRGHSDMFGSIITSPVNPEADFGIIFMDTGGYLNMCGHGSMGAVTVAIETGIIRATEPITNVKLDTPAGLVEAFAEVKDKTVKSVTIRNVPSFVFKRDAVVDVPKLGKITLDIAFGGSFFALVDADSLNIALIPENAEQIAELGMLVKDAVNSSISVVHPQKPHINTVDLVEFYGKTDTEGADLRNVVVFGKKQIDRSPCGTGTSAKMALLYDKGELGLNQDFYYESIIGTIFRGKLIKEVKVGDFAAVIPEITGKAFITGFSQYIIDSEDPLKYGFLLG